jgi:hypothetical protein
LCAFCSLFGVFIFKLMNKVGFKNFMNFIQD